MTSGVQETGHDRAPRAPRDARPATPRAGGSAAAAGVTAAVLLAAAPAEGGTAAALQRFEQTTLLRRLVDQFAALGVRDLLVVTRPAYEDAVRAELVGAPAARVVAPEDTAGDLAAVAQLAAGGEGGVVVAQAEIVTQREALAGLLADPRLSTAILVKPGAPPRGYALRVRARRGRVLSAASPFHSVHRPGASFLSVLKVGGAERAALAEVATRLAALTAPAPAPAWLAEYRRKAGMWRVSMALTALREAGAALPPEPPAPEAVELTDADEAALARRHAALREDVSSLVLTGLVRSGVHVGNSYLRRLFWARPLSAEAVAQATEDIALYDEDRVLLESAVKANDGFFTTFLVSPYSKYIARWAARRGLTPNQVTTISVLIGVLAAAAFATGERAGLVAGAVLLQISFTTDCVDGQLARYTRQFSKLGAWLDSVFDRTKEYAVFAGLAIGAGRMGDPAWLLAGLALTLQTARHMVDFSYAGAQQHAIGTAAQPPLEQPSDRLGAGNVLEVEEPDPDAEDPGVPPRDPADPEPAAEPAPRPSPARRGLELWHTFDRLPPVRWIKKMIAFPIGERFAVISLTAALFTPHTTFVVLLAWGLFAAAYTLAGRVLRSLAR